MKFLLPHESHKGHLVGGRWGWTLMEIVGRPKPLNIDHKVDNPYSIIFMIETPIFEWYVTWCDYNNIHQKVILAQNKMTILGSQSVGHFLIRSRLMFKHIFSENVLY